MGSSTGTEETPVPAIGPEQVQAVLRFLPLFERLSTFGEWCTPEGQFPYFAPRPEVDEFLRTLYAGQFVFPFDWSAWTSEAERYMAHPEQLETADLLTLRRLLTVHVRADRFNEGHLAHLLESGHITAILRHLQQIAATGG